MQIKIVRTKQDGTIETLETFEGDPPFLIVATQKLQAAMVTESRQGRKHACALCLEPVE